MIAPQLPGVTGDLVDLPRYCVDDDYGLSQKVNGRRLMLVADHGEVLGINKKGVATDVPSAIAQQAARLHGRVVLDGEVLNNRFVMFDLVSANDQIVPSTPYTVRRTVLESLHELWAPGESVLLLPVARTIETKALLAKRLYVAKAEGCVVNRLDAVYTPGEENPDLLRFKYTKTIDCVVIDIHRDGKENMAVGLFEPDNPTPVEVAECTACAGDGPQIVEQYKRYLEGNAPQPVIEVTFLYTSVPNEKNRYGRLVQPTMPLLRDDKTPTECTVDQMQYESKELLNV